MGMSQYRVDMGTARNRELTGGNLTRFNELMTNEGYLRRHPGYPLN
jgi:hypothetical protein